MKVPVLFPSPSSALVLCDSGDEVIILRPMHSFLSSTFPPLFALDLGTCLPRKFVAVADVLGNG
jgi:hypothetical protein